MIIYSVIPWEMIFQDAQAKEPEKPMEIDYRGLKMEVCPLENNSYKIVRLLSTDLSNYLDPKLTPGSVIEMGPL